MKHDWEYLPQTVQNYIKYQGGPVRKCRNCGKVQVKESQHLWMRVVGYTWQPLAGRCKPEKRKGKHARK